MPALSLQKTVFRYSTGFAVKNIDLEIPEQSFLALIGPNGSGKTTLLKVMSGLLPPDSGRVLLDKTPIDQFPVRELAKHIAVISSEQYFEFPFTVAEIVTMGRFPHLPRLRGPSSQDSEIVDKALEMTQTTDLRKRSISQLSSGERQRVLIARAVAQEPSILMLDEPNAHLDINHQIAVFRLLKHLNEKNLKTIVVVLHDLTAAAAYCKSIALMSAGRLVKTGAPREVLTTEIVQSVYKADVEMHPSPLAGLPQIVYPVE